MNRWTCAGIALAVLVAAVTMATPAFAQRDAGAKARGDFGRGFWNSYPARTHYRYVPMYSATPQYRTYSYQSIGINPGDKVQISADKAKLMDGPRVVTTIDKGQKFEVRKVTNGWLRADITRDGKKLKGWVWHNNVKFQDSNSAVR
jgi:hypothetical protein